MKGERVCVCTCVPLDPVNRSSSVASRQSTGLECPSATATHCRGAVLPPFSPAMGLITPLHRDTHIQNCTNRQDVHAESWQVVCFDRFCFCVNALQSLADLSPKAPPFPSSSSKPPCSVLLHLCRVHYQYCAP